MSQQTGVVLQGRIISRERVVKATNQKVTFYSLGTVKGWFQLNVDKSIDMNKIEIPGLVEVNVTGIRNKKTTTDDGREYDNKTLYVTSVKQVESAPEYEAFLQKKLEEELQ